MTDIEKFGYNAASIPVDTTLKVQFSQDGTNWYNSSDVEDGWDTLSEGNNLAEGDAIDLSTLVWAGRDFYYQVQFETSDTEATSILEEVNVFYLPGIYVTTELATYVTANSAAGNGTINTVDGGNATTRGFKYGVTQTDTWDVHEDGSFGIESYFLDIADLDSLTTYYIRAYTVNSRGTTYGDWVSFTTGSYYDLGTFTSTNILYDSCATTIDEFGYNASSVPAGTTLKVQFSQNAANWYSSSGVENEWDTLSEGNYLADIDAIDLSGLGWTGRNFYYKVQFESNSPTNDSAPILDEIVVYNTPGTCVSTQYATLVTADSSLGNGNIYELNGGNPTIRGFKYGLTQTDTWDVHEEGDFTTGSYSLDVTVLDPLTTYYIRAYATNPRGITYGDWVSFTTSGNYSSSGTLTSTNFLSGYEVETINRFVYNLTAKPEGTTATIQFSQDGETWYNSAGTPGGTDTMKKGINSVNLVDLEWTGDNFYYQIEFTSATGDETPALSEVSVLINDPPGIRLEGVQMEGICVGDAPCF